MHWDIRLKPHEYWAMDAEEWHTANAVQAAYREGADAAAEDHRKEQAAQAERERKQRESEERLRAKTGA